MINTVIISKEEDCLKLLNQKIKQLFPDLSIGGQTAKKTEIPSLVSRVKPDLVVMDYELYSGNSTLCTYRSHHHFEAVFLSNTKAHAVDAFQCCAAGYIVKPIDDALLEVAIKNACSRIDFKSYVSENEIIKIINLSRAMSCQPVFIPTMDGFELVTVGEIVRCEGREKTTLIITTDSSQKPVIRSSYNIGVFRKELEKYGFYSPHKSHLINPVFIRKYSKEGYIYMNNGDKVPLARRRKCDFLSRIPNLCGR